MRRERSGAATGIPMYGSYCIWPGGVLFFGGDVRTEWARPFTASLVFAPSAHLRLRIGRDREWRTIRGALVAPNVPGELDASGGLVALKIDPETDAYARVAWRLAGGPVHELPPSVSDELSDAARVLLGGPAFSPARLWDIVLDRVGGPPGCGRRFDPRIAQVLDRLKGDFTSPPPAARLAADVGLSEGRLLHLFREQVGVPLRRYVLWLRLRHVVYVMVLTGNLTEAAHAAGFCDSGHLSRTFRSMCGICPSDLFRHDDRVRFVLGFPRTRLEGPHAAHDAHLWDSAATALAQQGLSGRSGEEPRWLPVVMSGEGDGLAFHVAPVTNRSWCPGDPAPSPAGDPSCAARW